MAKRLIPRLPILLLLALSAGTLCGWHWFDPAARKNQKGIEAYRQGKFAGALEQFLSAKGLKADAAQLKSNTAATLYQLKKYQEAVAEFSRIDPAKLGTGQADLHYDLGNAYFRLGQFPQALESYKRCLLLHPDDLPAKKNFELTLKKIQEQQEKQNQKQEQPQDPQAEAERQKQKYSAVMQFLNQNEKKQMEKKKRKISPVKNEKDW